MLLKTKIKFNEILVFELTFLVKTSKWTNNNGPINILKINFWSNFCSISLQMASKFVMNLPLAITTSHVAVNFQVHVIVSIGDVQIQMPLNRWKFWYFSLETFKWLDLNFSPKLSSNFKFTNLTLVDLTRAVIKWS